MSNKSFRRFKSSILGPRIEWYKLFNNPDTRECTYRFILGIDLDRAYDPIPNTHELYGCIPKRCSGSCTSNHIYEGRLRGLARAAFMRIYRK